MGSALSAESTLASGAESVSSTDTGARGISCSGRGYSSSPSGPSAGVACMGSALSTEPMSASGAGSAAPPSATQVSGPVSPLEEGGARGSCYFGGPSCAPSATSAAAGPLMLQSGPASEEYIADIVSADDSGLLCIWKAGEDFKLLNKIPAYGCSCSSVKLWCGIVIAGYGSGQIRLYDALSGMVHAEVNAHARWIYALDIAPDSGKLLSGAEDSLVRIWKLSKSPESHTVEIEHQHTECVTDVQICGAKFCDPEGSAFAVTGYDLSEIIRYTVV
ncbi:UNVERIFIED_CONTAM: hypothetical protein FKN15_051414 [Acipenser sinensis]